MGPLEACKLFLEGPGRLLSRLPLGLRASQRCWRMDLEPRFRPRAPHPRRYLVLILLQQQSQVRGIASHIIVRAEVSFFESFLGASATNALVLLSLGTQAFPILRAASREIFCIFLRLYDWAFADRHRLARLVFP